jgi:hypothetical protein
MLGPNSQSYVALNTKVWVEGHRRGYERGQRQQMKAVTVPRCPINEHLGIFYRIVKR